MHDDVHPRSRGLHGFLVTIEQQGENDPGDRDVERHAATHEIEEHCPFGLPEHRGRHQQQDGKDVALDREEAEEVPEPETAALVENRELIRHRSHARRRESEAQHAEPDVAGAH